MGYYSFMTVSDVIHTDYDIDTIKFMFKDYINTTENGNYMDVYDFVEEDKGVVRLELPDVYSKHYANRELAEFISKIIKEGHQVKYLKLNILKGL